MKIAHTYRGGNGFMWAFLVVGVLCPFVDRHKGKLRSIINRKVHTRPSCPADTEGQPGQ